MEEPTPKSESKKKTIARLRRPLLYVLAGVLLGAFLLGAFRYFNLKDNHTHYHANSALYINGQRDEFKLPTYYEEVQSCGADPDNPRARAHMHDMDPSTVHVHDHGVTWSAFFANVGYNLGNNLVKTSSGTYIDGQDGNKLTFILNGESVVDVANRVIGDDDVLLISYGQEDRAALQKQYDAIPRSAHEHDVTSDPATCSGSKSLTWRERLKAAVGLN